MTSRILSVLSLAVVAFGFVGAAHADIVAATPTDSASIRQAQPFAVGWEFTVNQTISITSLGAFDVAGDGHPTDQKVRLYDSTNDAILATATIASSASAESVGGYNAYFQSITPITLTTGKHYIVASDQAVGGDFMVSNAAFGSAINMVQGQATWFDGNLPDSISGFDTRVANASPYFGANFKYSAVPEPATAMLLTTGLVALLAYAWRKRK
jgi:hypothetical protein